MHRFFVSLVPCLGEMFVADGYRKYELPDEVAHQVRDVLRLHTGEKMVLLDNSGYDVVASLTRIEKRHVEVELVERSRNTRDLPIQIALFQGMMKSTARFEWILEKCTELGVSRIVPVLCARSEKGLEQVGAAKQQRWQHVLQEATEQCGGARIPVLSKPVRFEDVFSERNRITNTAANQAVIDKQDVPIFQEDNEEAWQESLGSADREMTSALACEKKKLQGEKIHLQAQRHSMSPESERSICILPYEEAENISFVEVTREYITNGYKKCLCDEICKDDAHISEIAVCIGPEGGFTEDEVAWAQLHGAHIVTLGTRILRAETAAVTAIATIAQMLCE